MMKRTMWRAMAGAVLLPWAIACFEDHDPTAGFKPNASPEVACRTVTSTLGTEQLMVRATIDGEHSGWFLFESATSYIIVDSRRVDLSAHLQVGSGQFPRPCRTPVTFYQSDHLDVGPMRIRYAYVGMADLTELENLLGEPVLGIIGAAVFHRAVVEVDFAANDGQGRVAIYDPEEYALDRGEWQPIELSRFEIVVPATFERAVKGPFVIDTGYSGNAAIFSAFAVNKRLEEGRQFTSHPAFTICGRASERRARIDKFTFGGRTFDDPEVAFMEPGSASDVNTGRLGGVIGRGFLDDVVLVTDVRNGRIAFVPRGDTTRAQR
jgi:hypothetical protein